MYLLDTNVCIEIIRGRPANVRERFQLAVMEGTSLFVSSVSNFELWYGVEKSDRQQVNRKLVESFLSGPLQVLSFDGEDAERAGAVRAALELQGKTIGPFDTLIAGQALRHELILITANTREFSRVKGLELENWGR
jgi:tRNA(fMet)-specific endonuclease VapC